MASRRNVRYSSLPSEDGDDSNLTKEDVDLRYTYTPKSFRRIPWKSIALALFLLLLGTSLLFLSYFIFTGHMEGDSSQAYGLLFLGFLAFLPDSEVPFNVVIAQLHLVSSKRNVLISYKTTCLCYGYGKRDIYMIFIAGFYETRVAYYSWRGAPGYTFASIPDY
nr:unnamed protein product [Digitaria exilis]